MNFIKKLKKLLKQSTETPSQRVERWGKEISESEIVKENLKKQKQLTIEDFDKAKDKVEKKKKSKPVTYNF